MERTDSDLVIAVIDRKNRAIAAYVKSITFKNYKKGNFRITFGGFDEALVFAHYVYPLAILNTANVGVLKPGFDYRILTVQSCKEIESKNEKEDK